MTKHVVLYGAFDRYNYGDNLMPILLERFFLSEYVKCSKDYEFIYASINSSDLSCYKCKPSVPIKSLLKNDIDYNIIVVGGEVMGADVGTLFSHVQNNIFYAKAINFTKRVSPKFVNAYAKLFYPAAWDYPYIPRKNSFKGKVKIIYNTVGGVPVKSQWEYVKDADYVSVRDQRSYDGMKKICNLNLIPDSVLIASKLVDNDFFKSNVRPGIIALCQNKRFITLQACPYKVKFTPKDLALVLDDIKREKAMDVILLPIGYASGHDDSLFLSEVKKYSREEIELLDDLNVWEIMFIISKAKAFYGTSLHGVITAMSFGVPHYCINSDIKKLTSFLNTWSISPFNESLTINNIFNSISYIESYDNTQLLESVENTQGLIMSSLNDIVNMLE